MATIRNAKLRKMMDKAGYQNYDLVKGEGYFYVASDYTEESNILDSLYSTDIMVYAFNQQDVESWFRDVQDIIEEAKRGYSNR